MKPKRQKGDIAPEDFPALRNFLRGYFHQDMKDEYGSAPKAAEQFCRDASAEERDLLVIDWVGFLKKMEGQPLSEFNRVLTTTLSSAYSLSDEDRNKITSTLERSSGEIR
jgi:hypothetical protein